MSEQCGFCGKKILKEDYFYLGKFSCYCCKECYEEKKYLGGV